MSLRFEAKKQDYDREIKNIRVKIFRLPVNNSHRIAIEECIHHYEKRVVTLRFYDDDEGLLKTFNETITAINFELLNIV